MLKGKWLSYKRHFYLLVLLALPIGLAIMPISWVEGDQYSFCLWHHLFGGSCYGCGITRALVCALHLDFERAWAYNRLVVVVLPVFVYLWGDMVVRVIKVMRKVP